MKKHHLTKLIFSGLLTACPFLGLVAQTSYVNNGEIGPSRFEADLSSSGYTAPVYSLNNFYLGSNPGNYSGNLGAFIGKAPHNMGLHIYNIRNTEGNTWTTAKVRLASTVDGGSYSQDHRYNNLAWIDFVGNSNSLRIGFSTNEPTATFTNGRLGIGTTDPDAALTVKGTVHAQEVKVDLNGAVAPDFVFDKDYPLKSLKEVEAFILINKHLPEIPSGGSLETNGIDLKTMNLSLLQKVEELTLYLIEHHKQLDHQKKINELQEKRILYLEKKFLDSKP